MTSKGMIRLVIWCVCVILLIYFCGSRMNGEPQSGETVAPSPAAERAGAIDEIPEVHIVDITPPIVSDCFEDKPVRYKLSEFERDGVERVVMAESGGESYKGQMLVAQCILNAAEKEGISPSEAVVKYKYTKSRPEPTDQVRQAVSAVFDLGETVTDEPILYFYNPKHCVSSWHESQVFVIEVGGHRFFKLNG